MRPREFLSRDLREAVGDRRPNRQDDVATVERLVGGAGHSPFRPDREPTGLFSGPLRDSIRRFQRQSGLQDDGIVEPDGETFDALRREGSLDEQATGRAGDGTNADPRSQPRRRCGQIAARLRNLAFDLRDIEERIERDRRNFDQALERVEEAATAKAREPAVIAAAVAGIASSLATGNLLLAAIEGAALAARLTNTETNLNVESRALDQAAETLREALERREEIASETTEFEAERDRLGCSFVGF